MNEQELARREAALREKEAELDRREQALDAAEGTEPQPGSAPRGPRNAKERLYDRIHIPIWLLDAIIAGCVVAFFVVVALGALKGRGVL